jgi:mRNA interferase MazF
MTRYNPCAVVLVHFPFTQLQAAKKRPAVVISPVEYAQRYGDLAVIGLTSRVQPEEFLSLKHWQAAGLLAPSWIKPAIFTLAESIIDRQIGTLSSEDASRIPEALALLVASPYRP